MILVIDNYDSFTFNLVQYLGELATDFAVAEEIVVKRNDQLSILQIIELSPNAIILSPGPGDPDQSGICLEVVQKLSSDIPILGVCLGHQTIAQVFGGKITGASELVHGKTSKIFHNNKGVFYGLANPFIGTRYHSLVAEKVSLPDCFDVTAWLEDGTIMGIMHKKYLHLQGVQFHPESVLTEFGHDLLKNFLSLTKMRE